MEMDKEGQWQPSALEKQQQHLITVPSSEVFFYEMHNEDRCDTNTPHLYSDVSNKTLLLAY